MLEMPTYLHMSHTHITPFAFKKPFHKGLLACSVDETAVVSPTLLWMYRLRGDILKAGCPRKIRD